MGDERDDDADQRRADVYSSARIGAAAALTIVLVVLLVLDVAVPDYDISPGILLPLLGAILALLGLEILRGLARREVSPIYWVGSPRLTARHPAPLERLGPSPHGRHAPFNRRRVHLDRRTRGLDEFRRRLRLRPRRPPDHRPHPPVRGLGDQAGQRQLGPSGASDDRYPTRLLNSRTVSIEHHDNDGRTAGSGKGVVPEAGPRDGWSYQAWGAGLTFAARRICSEAPLADLPQSRDRRG